MYSRLRNLHEIKGYGLFVICMALVGVAVSLSGPFLSLFCTEVIGMSTAAFGIFMAMNSLSGVVVNTLIAKRSDSGLDRKYIIAVATVSSALGSASYLVFHNYYILLIVVAVLSGCGAPAMPQIFAYAREAANDSQSDDKTFATSTLRSLFSLGFVIGPLIGTVVLSQVGFSGLFIGTSTLFLIIASIVFFLLKRKPVAITNQATRQSTGLLAQRKDLLKPFIAFILLYAANWTYNINTPLFIVHKLHGTPQDVGLVISLCAGLEIPLMIGLGALAKKFPNRLLMMVGCLIAMVYYIIMGVSSQIWQLIAAQILQASFIAIVMGIGLSYFQDLMPDSPGIATTIYSNASSLGVLVGNLSGGFVAQVAGYRNVYWVCLVIVAVSFTMLRRTKSQTTVIAGESSQSM